LHEQLIFAGVRLGGDRPERLGVADTEAALAQALDAAVPAPLKDRLAIVLNDAAEPLRRCTASARG